jgi:hypothetical protein
MTAIREGHLEFAFGSTWEVLKYDKDGAYYRTLMAKNVEPTKAVDFLCLSGNQPLLMLEAKDFSLGVPDRTKFDQVPMAVAVKARDTVAGIVGGCHNDPDRSAQRFFRRSYERLAKAPRVIYFFEDLATPVRRPAQRKLIMRDVLLKQLKRHLKWLTRDIVVVGLDDYPSYIADLTIRQV